MHTLDSLCQSSSARNASGEERGAGWLSDALMDALSGILSRECFWRDRGGLADYHMSCEVRFRGMQSLWISDKQMRPAGEAVAEQIRRRVREETKLTCSCGIGPNRLLSKIATDMRKPDGQFAIGCDHAAIHRFIDPLPVRKIPGIGKVGCPATDQLICASASASTSAYNLCPAISDLPAGCG